MAKKKKKKLGGNIVVIGPRSSGKTTYLAGLAYWSDRIDNVKLQNQGEQRFNIKALNSDAKNLKRQARNIIIEGDSFRATKVVPEGLNINEIDEKKLSSLEQLPTYSFNLKINHRFSNPESINLVVKDYAGELFDEHLDSLNSHSLYQRIWQESLSGDIEGSLILISGWEEKNDERYSHTLEKFINLMKQNDRLDNYRVAIAISKCERGEIWPGRIEPEIDIFNQYLPRTMASLRSKVPRTNLKFYALSTFGVLGQNKPLPNRKLLLAKREASALREQENWNPYNLIAPLYWLGTGKKMKSYV